MSSSQALFRGRVQAQGDDIEQDGGYSQSWARHVPVTDKEGYEFLDKLEEQCSEAQRLERKQPFAKARRFVKHASEQEGGVGPESQPPSYRNLRSKFKNARVDIEIGSGQTFIRA